ncbi:MAG: ADP-ribosylglycohydrolase family protein [Kiritimatiellia bacterium]
MPPFTGWSSIAGHLKFECIQAEYEGKIVPESLKKRVEQLDTTTDLFDDPEAKELFNAMEDLDTDPDFGYEQPDALEEIRRLRPEGPRRLEVVLSDDQLLDRFHGAWTGRFCGCALGKPVEGMCLIHRGRLRLKDYLERRGHWPLDNYISGVPRDDDKHSVSPADPATRENISCMPPDDDIHYTLTGLHVLEKNGADFKWYNVADAWNGCLPFSAICTAESQAITNYNIRNVRGKNGAYPSPAWTARHNNPYREWIGAQIRADGWAYCAAGNPELAAEFAWRDAHWTHTANGIYGEMFMAAVIASAFVMDDPEELVRAGLSEIPANCRLAEGIRRALKWVRECPDIESFMEALEGQYGEWMHPVHTVNNAMICVAALFYGKMDTAESICTAVTGGLDTDCNGATAGSIVGAVSGHEAFSGTFKAPLNDTVKPLMLGFQEVKMEELARRTFEVYKRITQS